MGMGSPDSGTVACSLDRDCGRTPDHVCVNSICRSGCKRNEDCEDTLRCDLDSGHCLVTGPCQSSAECAPPLSVCRSGRCQSGCTVGTSPCRADTVCSLASGLCVGTSTCTGDASCGFGYWCDGTGCRQRCNEPGAPVCRGDSSCNPDTGRCEGGLDLGASCDVDRECASGDCLGVVVNGSTSRVCSRTCGATAECPLGTSCIPVSSAGQCLPSNLLSGGSALSVRSGLRCSVEDNQCQSLVCEGSLCVERCGRDADCAAFGGSCVAVPQAAGALRLRIPRCVDPFVGAADNEACGGDLDCGKAVCDPASSTCARLCCAEEDCGDDEACRPLAVDDAIVRVCRRGMPSGSRVYGAPCETDDQCQSGVCGPADPANLNGAQVCTTYCCGDRDCDVLPGSSPRCVSLPGPLADSVTGRCVLR